MRRSSHSLRTAIIASALSLLVLMGGVTPAAERLSAGEILDRVQGWLDETRDLQGKFEQRLESGVFGDSVTESGRLWIARPGRMRWEYQRPEVKVAIVKNGKTWLYLEEDRQLQLGQLDHDTRLLPMLLAGDGRLAELFDPELVEPEGGSRDGAYRLRLTPTSDSDAFEEVVVITTAPEFAVEGVEVLDAVGNRGSYRFTRIRRNRGLSDDLFRFDPEPGVEILGTHDP